MKPITLRKKSLHRQRVAIRPPQQDTTRPLFWRVIYRLLGPVRFLQRVAG